MAQELAIPCIEHCGPDEHFAPVADVEHRLVAALLDPRDVLERDEASLERERDPGRHRPSRHARASAGARAVRRRRR
jgi:hypothetical protein